MNLPQTNVIRPRSFRIDLSTARDEEKQAWNFTHFRIANASSSTALLYLKTQEHSNSDVLLYAGRRLKNWPTNTVWLTNAAQAGEWVDIEFWGGPVIGPPEIVDDAVVATLPGSISAEVNSFNAALPQEPVLPRELPETGYMRLSVSAALNTIFTPAANVNGAIVRLSGMNSGTDQVRIMAKSSAPSSVTDGVGVWFYYSETASGTTVTEKNGDGWAYIPAGLGLYEQATGAGAETGVDLSYTLL